MATKWRNLRVKTDDGIRTFDSEEEYEAFLGEREKDIATDGARELAAKKGIDLSAVEGSGEGGRILKSDVQAIE